MVEAPSVEVESAPPEYMEDIVIPDEVQVEESVPDFEDGPVMETLPEVTMNVQTQSFKSEKTGQYELQIGQVKFYQDVDSIL